VSRDRRAGLTRRDACAAHWDFVATLGDKPVWHDFL
jgi:hypothetical protein